MPVFSKISTWARIALDTLLITPRRLRSIDQQLKAALQIKDGIFSFPYRDTIIHLALPDACRDSIQTNIVDAGTFWECAQLERVKKIIKPGSVIADCGANIGNHTIFFSKICKASKVHAFEPQSYCCKLLERQITLNNVEDSVAIHHVALGNKQGTMSISTYHQGNIGGTSFSYDEGGSVPAITLDSLNLEKLDFMKIDVEGAQLALLEGARETINKCSPTIWVELLGREAMDFENERIKPQRLLAELGYSLQETLSETDFIFAKR